LTKILIYSIIKLALIKPKGGEILMKYLSLVGTLLVVVGALNWGLVGLSGLLGYPSWNLVEMLLGSMPVLANLVYVLVGVAGLWLLWDWYMKMGKK